MSKESYLSYFAPDDTLAPEELSAILMRRAAALAAPPPDEAQEDAFTLFTFSLNAEQYGIEAKNVISILPLTSITPVPRAPAFVLGVIGARGRLLSVIDLRRFFGLSATETGADDKIVVVGQENMNANANNGMEAGIVVNSVDDLTTIFKSSVEQTLTTQHGRQAKFIQGIAPGMLTILNLNALLSDPQFIIHEKLS